MGARLAPFAGGANRHGLVGMFPTHAGRTTPSSEHGPVCLDVPARGGHPPTIDLYVNPAQILVDV
jgi:hypothetical protein